MVEDLQTELRDDGREHVPKSTSASIRHRLPVLGRPSLLSHRTIYGIEKSHETYRTLSREPVVDLSFRVRTIPMKEHGPKASTPESRPGTRLEALRSKRKAPSETLT